MSHPDLPLLDLLPEFTLIAPGLYKQNDFLIQKFEQEYISLREKEGRVYADQVVSELPAFSGAADLEKEWAIRKRSTNRFVHYLLKYKPACSVLEVGCGNGWMSNYIATRTSSHVVGTDVNHTELAQAARVFTMPGRLLFILAEFARIKLPEQTFDIIVFPSVIQYFRDLRVPLLKAMSLLRPDGEVHILDSPFYDQSEVAGAADRSKKYFDQQGSSMASFYFHHSWKDLTPYHPTVLHDPKRMSFSKLLRRPDSPFPWLKISKDRLS